MIFAVTTFIDKPEPADYDGNGKTDGIVFRDGNWYRLNSSSNQFFAVQFGIITDKPVPNAFVSRRSQTSMEIHNYANK